MKFMNLIPPVIVDSLQLAKFPVWRAYVEALSKASGQNVVLRKSKLVFFSALTHVNREGCSMLLLRSASSLSCPMEIFSDQ